VRLDQQAVQEAKQTLSFDDGVQQKKREDKIYNT
jgi:hypothetical protein